MQRPPRSQSEPLLNTAILCPRLVLVRDDRIGGVDVGIFLHQLVERLARRALAQEGTLLYAMATTMTFAGVVATQVGAVFGCRTDRQSVFRLGLFTNRLILVGIAVELALLAILVYVPFMQNIFNTAPIGLVGWVFVFAWTPVIFLLDEGRKAILRYRSKGARTM